MKLEAALLAAFAASVLPGNAFADVPPPPSALAYYRAALAQMRQIKQPAYLTYRTIVPAGKSTIVVSREPDGRTAVALVIETKTQPAQSWNVAYRTSDSVASIALPDGKNMISALPFFDPTWSGAYAWMHKGFDAVALSSNPSPSPSPPSAVSAAAPSAPPEPPVIAVVSALGEGYYRIEDAGSETCSGGRPGHHLHAIARSDPDAHPLTDVVIDTQTMRFCSMRFHERVGNGFLGLAFDIDLHFGEVGTYYLITDGTIVGVGKALLVQAFHVATAFRYEGTAFPNALPEALFAPDAPRSH